MLFVPLANYLFYSVRYDPSSTVSSGNYLCSFIKKCATDNRQQRIARIFLSSTFNDMHKEREVIVRKVMVELEQYCYERSVHLSYIDMRWGIIIITVFLM